MDNLPDLTGQPGWVIIVVTGLTVIGTVAGAILQRSEKRSRRKRERREHDKRPVELPQSVPSGPAGQADVLGASVNAIIEHARRESQEANEARLEARHAREETRALRAKYEQAMQELAAAQRRAERALADLATCTADVEELRIQLDGTS